MRQTYDRTLISIIVYELNVHAQRVSESPGAAIYLKIKLVCLNIMFSYAREKNY